MSEIKIKNSIFYNGRFPFTKIHIWFVSIVLAATSVRGFLVINTGISPEFIYYSIATLAILLSFFGYLIKSNYKGKEITLLKNLLKINFFLGILNMAIAQFLGQTFDFGLLYLFLAPYVVFITLRIPEPYLMGIIIVVLIMISWSTAINFFQTLQGVDGIDSVLDYKQRLRPGIEALSRTGNYFRVGGYTGNYHDSANILGMMMMFFGLKCLVNLRFIYLVAAVVSTITLTLTQSAANILLAFISFLIFTIYYFCSCRRPIFFLHLLLILVAFGGALYLMSDFTSIFLNRVGVNGDWDGMLGGLSTENITHTLAIIILGHGAALGSELIITEIAFVKIILQIGLMHSIFLFTLLLFPHYIFLKIPKKTIQITQATLPSLGACFFGFISLAHYGSLFRITSIFLYFIFFTIAILNVLGRDDLR